MYTCQSQLLKQFKWLMLISLFSVITSTSVYADDPCAGLNNSLYGICNAYCNAKKCGTPNQNGSDNSCNVLKDSYFQRASAPLPCIVAPSISVTKKTDGFVYDPSNLSSVIKLLVNTSVTWTYSVNNTGTVPVTVSSITDAASMGANPVVKCGSTVLPASVASGATLQCSAMGTVQAGNYVNTVTVIATANGQTVTAEANGAYQGVAPGILITSTPSVPSVIVGSSYTFNYQVSNTGSSALSNITYSDALGMPVGCPTSLAVGEKESCSSPTLTANSVGQVNDSITVTALFVDANGSTQQANDTAKSQLVVEPDPVLTFIDHTIFSWPAGTSISNVTAGANGNCSIVFTGTVPQFPNQIISNNTFFLTISPNNQNGPQQEIRIVDPVNGIICDAPSALLDTSQVIKNICPSNIFTANTPAITLQQLSDWCVTNNGKSFTYTPQ